MSNPIKFSIVITTYNRLQFLKRAVESALAQTVPCEVVVADDCSTDGTEEYCHSLGGRIIYHRNPSNLGHSACVNAGAKIAKGDWIKILDDDDYLTSNCIEEITQAIAKHPQAVVCSCQAVNIDIDGKEKGRTGQRGPGKAFYVPQEDIHYGMLLDLLPFGVASQLAFRKEAFLKFGLWNAKFDLTVDDVYSCANITQFGDAIFVNLYLVYYNIWRGGYAKSFPLQEFLNKHILLKEKIYSFISKKHRSSVPALEDIKDYLNLHWSLVALKRKKLVSATKIAFPAVFSYNAWKLLFRALLARQRNYQDPRIRKIGLLDS